MKKFNKLFALLLAVVLIFGLVACGEKKPEGPDTDSIGGTEVDRPDDSIGSVMLVTGTKIAVYYDANGKAVWIVDDNGEECFSELVGKPCAEAVPEILKAQELTPDVKCLLIKQGVNTLVPNDDFLQGVVDAAKTIVGELPVVLCSAEELDHNGYFSPSTAETMLNIFLGNPQAAKYTCNTTPVDGYYQITAEVEGEERLFSVGALYGAVEELSTFAEEDDIFIDTETLPYESEAEVETDPVPEELPTDEPAEDVPVEN